MKNLGLYITVESFNSNLPSPKKKSNNNINVGQFSHGKQSCHLANKQLLILHIFLPSLIN